MILSVVIVEIFKMSFGGYVNGVYVGIFAENVYTTMCVFAMTCAGLINLFVICKPLNNYRATLFLGASLSVLIIAIIALTSGFSFLELVQMVPLKDYWHHLLIMVTVILADIPICLGLQKLFNKLDITKKFIKKK